MDLNNYVDFHIKKDGLYVGIIEISIASQKINIIIFIYEERSLNNNHYILDEKIDSDDLNLIIWESFFYNIRKKYS